MSILQTIKDKITAVFHGEPSKLNDIKTEIKTPAAYQADVLPEEAALSDFPTAQNQTDVHTKPPTLTFDNDLSTLEHAPIASTEKQGSNEVSDAAALAAVALEHMQAEQPLAELEQSVEDVARDLESEPEAHNAAAVENNALPSDTVAEASAIEHIDSLDPIEQPAEAVAPAIVPVQDQLSSIPVEVDSSVIESQDDEHSSASNDEVAAAMAESINEDKRSVTTDEEAAPDRVSIEKELVSTFAEAVGPAIVAKNEQDLSMAAETTAAVIDPNPEQASSAKVEFERIQRQNSVDQTD